MYKKQSAIYKYPIPETEGDSYIVSRSLSPKNEIIFTTKENYA